MDHLICHPVSNVKCEWVETIYTRNAEETPTDDWHIWTFDPETRSWYHAGIVGNTEVPDG
jgi:hypothetical protein